MARGRGHYEPIKRMNKHLLDAGVLSHASPGSNVTATQLETGEEECQIKRLVISMTTAEAACKFKVGLFQKPPTSADFTDDTIIYSFIGKNQVWLNETTTVRVPQGWYVAILTQNPATSPVQDIGAHVQINYLSMG